MKYRPNVDHAKCSLTAMARKSFGGAERLKNKNARSAFTARHKLEMVASFDELGDMSAVIRKLYPNVT